MSTISERTERFAAVLVEFDRELDWPRLGELYCHEGGEEFFPPAQVAAQREAGLSLAAELARALETLPVSSEGRSLYVGAALAELAPALFEAVVPRREVLLHNLPGPEPDEINRALAAVEGTVGEALPRIRANGLEVVEGTFDHAWLTSVLTDPGHFPALHDRLYERRGEDATGRGDPDLEAGRARELVRSIVERLRPPALFTTTDEELGFVREACEVRGWRLEVPETARLSAIVGDPVRHCRVLALS